MTGVQTCALPIWYQARDQDERIVQISRNPLAIRFDADDAMLAEGIHAVCEQADRLNQVIGDDWHEDIELEVPLAGGNSQSGIVAHDLDGDHGNGFALRRIDFARHDRAARFIFGDADFPDAAARARRQPTDVIGNLHEVAGQGLEHTVDDDEFVFTGQGLELVRC